MIHVIFGEDVVSSRNKLVEMLLGKPNVIRLDGKKNSIAQLDETLLSNSLFSDSKTVVVESFTKLKPETKIWELLGKFENDKKVDVFLWDDTDLGKKKFSKSVQVFNFLFPKYYYAFLDGFEPDSKKSIELLWGVLKTLNSEQVLYGLVRRVRQLFHMKK